MIIQAEHFTYNNFRNKLYDWICKSKQWKGYIISYSMLITSLNAILKEYSMIGPFVSHHQTQF